jgi:hypothetical protein
MPRQKKSRKNDGTAAASIPSWFTNEESQDEDDPAIDPEYWDYWKNFKLPNEHAELFPAGYNFLTDVLAGKASFKMTDLDESAKRKICLELIKIYMDLGIHHRHVSVSGNIDDVVERVQTELPGLRMLLQHADKQQIQRRGKRDKAELKSRKLPASKSSSKAPTAGYEIGSREYWQNISFSDKIKKQNPVGYKFLQQVLAKKDSFNTFKGSQSELITACKELIRLYNSLKIGDIVRAQGNRSTLCSNIILNIPGMNDLLREAESAIVHNKDSMTSDDVETQQHDDDAVSGDRGGGQEDDHNVATHQDGEDNAVSGDKGGSQNDDNNVATHQDGEDNAVSGDKGGSQDTDNNVATHQDGDDNAVSGDKGGIQEYLMTVVDWRDCPGTLSVTDLWVKENSHDLIHRVLNIFSDRYMRKQKGVSKEHYSSVKDLLFRYICDYGVGIFLAKREIIEEEDIFNKAEDQSDYPIVAAVIADYCHEIEFPDEASKKSQFAFAVLLHTKVNKYLYKLLQHTMRNKDPEVTHVYFSSLNHRKDPLLMYKPVVRNKVEEHRNFVTSLCCSESDDTMVVPTYIYEPKTLSGAAKLVDCHRLEGNSITKVRKALMNLSRKIDGWSSLEPTEETFNKTAYHYCNPHVIINSDCYCCVNEEGQLKKYAIPYNLYFGKSNVNIYGSQIGFVSDYKSTFTTMEKEMGDSLLPMKKVVTHVRAGLSDSTDCCLWLAVMTMLRKYDRNTSTIMHDMLMDDRTKFRHMWVLRSRDKNEETFDHIMGKFGYNLKRHNTDYLFHPETKGLFVCLLKEDDGRTSHAIGIERTSRLLIYDFEDEYPFNPINGLDNFHGLCNSKKCTGLHLVAQLIPPKRKLKYFPF